MTIFRLISRPYSPQSSNFQRFLLCSFHFIQTWRQKLGTIMASDNYNNWSQDAKEVVINDIMNVTNRIQKNSRDAACEEDNTRELVNVCMYTHSQKKLYCILYSILSCILTIAPGNLHQQLTAGAFISAVQASKCVRSISQLSPELLFTTSKQAAQS